MAEQIFQGIILVSAVCNHNIWKHDVRFPCSLITTDVAPIGNWICLWTDNWAVWMDSVHSVGWICCVLCGKLFAFTQCHKWGTQLLNFCLFCECLLWKTLKIQNSAFFSPFSWPCLHGQCTERILCLGSHSFQMLAGRPARNLQKVSRRRSTNNSEMFLPVA